MTEHVVDVATLERPYQPPTERIINFIDPTVEFEDRASTRVWHFARVLAGVKLGAWTMIGSGTEIGFYSVIGRRSRIGCNVFLPNRTIVGEQVFIGPGVVCTDDRHPRVPNPGDPPYDARPPIFEDGCAIGAAAVILPGIRIGKNARVAAGAIVTRDVGEGEMVRGEPARVREGPEGWMQSTTPLAEDAGVAHE